MSGLAPCPFCGGQAHVKRNKTVLVSCTECGATTFQSLGDQSSAVVAWNRRAPLPAEQPSNPVGYFNAEHGVFWTFSELSADSALIRNGIAVPVFTQARIVGQQTKGGGLC